MNSKIGDEALAKWAVKLVQSNAMQRKFLIEMYGIRERYIRRLRMVSKIDTWSVYDIDHITYAIQRLTEMYGSDWDHMLNPGRYGEY